MYAIALRGFVVFDLPPCAQAGSSSSSRGDSLQDHLQRESLERYLTSRIQGVGPNRAKQLVELHGVGILQQLDGDAEAAIKALVQIRGVGRKTAEQMLRSWGQNAKKGGSPLPYCYTHLRSVIYGAV